MDLVKFANRNQNIKCIGGKKKNILKNFTSRKSKQFSPQKGFAEGLQLNIDTNEVPSQKAPGSAI